jgi:ABC-type phosphate transport system ATPase subunit
MSSDIPDFLRLCAGDNGTWSLMLRASQILRNLSRMPPKQPIIAIVGSTGTGKSDVRLTKHTSFNS